MKGHFNRHEVMTAETRSEILDLITDLQLADCKSSLLRNMMYGFFDGFDYTDDIPNHPEMVGLPQDLKVRVLAICDTVSKYPPSKKWAILK